MKYYKLNDLCTDIVDCPHTTPDWKNEGIRVVRNFNLKDGNLDFTDGYFVDESTYLERTKRAIPEEGDIIISREAPMGVVGIVPKGLKCCLGQRLVLLKVNNGKCDPYYLLNTLMSDFVQTQFKRADATGSIVSNLCIPDLKEIIIPVIESGQKDVARLLEIINKKQLINNAINDNLAYQLKDIYNYWFNQFNFPHNDKHQYKTDGGLMIWNDKIKRKIPASWEIKSFGELCSLRNGINYDKSVEGEKMYKIINVRNISSSDLILNENDFDEIGLPQKQGNKYCVSDNSIIVARSGIPGATRILQKPSGNIIFCGFIICCTPCDDIYKYYLMFYLKQLEGSAATKTGGSILQNVSQDTLSDLLVPIPPQSLLRKFNQIVSQSLELIHSNMQENTQLLKLRDWLLPMLMNGQATISD